MDPLPTFDEFQARSRAAGFTEVLERRWDPGTVVPEHTHPFSVDAIVTAGEMWLTVGAETRHMKAGDRFTLERDVPHAERYGVEGAAYWVARK